MIVKQLSNEVIKFGKTYLNIKIKNGCDFLKTFSSNDEKYINVIKQK